MSEHGAILEPTAACRDDGERLRELAGALRCEREERLRMEEATLEARKVLHELNNVLSIVATCAADLTEEIEPGHPSRESVEEIAQAAERVVALVRRLGDLQRLAAESGPRGEPSGQGRA